MHRLARETANNITYLKDVKFSVDTADHNIYHVVFPDTFSENEKYKAGRRMRESISKSPALNGMIRIKNRGEDYSVVLTENNPHEMESYINILEVAIAQRQDPTLDPPGNDSRKAFSALHLARTIAQTPQPLPGSKRKRSVDAGAPIDVDGTQEKEAEDESSITRANHSKTSAETAPKKPRLEQQTTAPFCTPYNLFSSAENSTREAHSETADKNKGNKMPVIRNEVPWDILNSSLYSSDETTPTRNPNK